MVPSTLKSQTNDAITIQKLTSRNSKKLMAVYDTIILDLFGKYTVQRKSVSHNSKCQKTYNIICINNIDWQGVQNLKLL